MVCKDNNYLLTFKILIIIRQKILILKEGISYKINKQEYYCKISFLLTIPLYHPLNLLFLAH